MWFRSKMPVALSLTERFNAAQALHGAAYAVFRDVVEQLDEAREHYLSVAAEANEEIARLKMIRDDSITSAARAGESTDAVLGLTRGIPV